MVKRRRLNPTGEDVYLSQDGSTLIRDEDKIIKAQRIFKHNYYKPGGRGSRRVLEKYVSRSSHGASTPWSDVKMFATILSLEPTEFMPLVPAPSVADYEYIGAAYEQYPANAKGLMDGALAVVADYRGSMLYLENGASMYRLDTGALGANGYLGAPVGEEGCYVNHGGKWWRARVTYE